MIGPLEAGTDSKERKRKCLARPGTSTAPLLDSTEALSVGQIHLYSRLTPFLPTIPSYSRLTPFPSLFLF